MDSTIPTTSSIRLQPRFGLSAIGPLGGSVCKTGRSSVSAYLRHDLSATSLDVAATLVDGVPTVLIEFVGPSVPSGPAARRVLYEGPLDAAEGPHPAHDAPTALWRLAQAFCSIFPLAESRAEDCGEESARRLHEALEVLRSVAPHCFNEQGDLKTVQGWAV
jgi:hypothetical protein